MKKFLLLLLVPLQLFAQPGLDSISGKIKRVENSLNPSLIFGDSLPNYNLEQRMRETHIKGLSLAVIKNYKIEWAKGYGWADSAENRKVNTETRFQAASISKSLNSMGILKLAEQGKLDTAADINQFLKSWQFPYDSVSKNKKITVLNLLSHTASLDIHGFPGYDRKDSFPTLIQVLNGERPANTKKVRSVGQPGKAFRYSGGGTTITQLILKDITGKDYAQWMQQNVLNPLGMRNSSYVQPPVDTANLATGYYNDGSPVPGKYHVYPEQAAAGLWTTPSDLARYMIDCQLTLKGEKGKILSTPMMKTRMTPYIDKNAALGVFIEKKGDQTWFTHNGGNEAFLCTSWGSMENGNGVVIMINGEDFSVINELLSSVATVYNWDGFYKPEFRKSVFIPRDTLAGYVGHFKMDKDTISLVMCGEQLCIQQNRQPATGYRVYFSDKTHFSIREEAATTFTLLFNESGKLEALELKDPRMKMKLPRIE